MNINKVFSLSILACFFIFFLQNTEARPRIRFNGSKLMRGAGNSENALTRDQLKQCILKEKEIKVIQERLKNRQTELESNNSALQQLENNIRNKRSSINRYEQDDVDTYNALISKHKVMIDGYNKSIEPYNEEMKVLNEKENTFNNLCAGKPYYEDDMKALSK